MVFVVQQYAKLMRFDKPIGIFLLLWPTLWALWLASGGNPPKKIVAIFVSGVVVMRACGCVINDIADREFDPHVSRTKTRPLASHTLTLKQAQITFILLACVALLLVCQLNLYCMELSVVGIVLTMIYPFAKRYTYWPQLILGAAFSWGIPMVYAALNVSMTSAMWLLYLAALLWPVAYDTMYAMADRQDDEKIGVKSTAILFGRQDRKIVLIIQLCVLLLLLSMGIASQLSWPFYIAWSVALGLSGYQQMLLSQRENHAYFRAFLNNHWLGAVIFLGIYWGLT